MVELLENVLGYASEPGFADTLHTLGHHGRVEYLTISPDETARRRFRLQTDRGTDCAVMLHRDQQLSDGAILKLDDAGAIVVRLNSRSWLVLDAPDKARALALGYFAGNLHWKVRFEGGQIHIALEGPKQTYLSRLEPLLADGSAILVGLSDG